MAQQSTIGMLREGDLVELYAGDDLGFPSTVESVSFDGPNVRVVTTHGMLDGDVNDPVTVLAWASLEES